MRIRWEGVRNVDVLYIWSLIRMSSSIPVGSFALCGRRNFARSAVSAHSKDYRVPKYI